MLEILLGDKLIPLAGKSLWVIGRESNCDVVIRDRTISRRHCTIYISEGVASITDGDLILDKPSSYGIKVNGIRLDPHHGQILNNNDLIELSPTISFKFFSATVAVNDDGQSTIL